MEAGPVEKVEESMSVGTSSGSTTPKEETQDEVPTGVQHRKDFTSEVNKIEIHNLGRFQYGDLRKLVYNKLHLKPTKMKTPSKFGGKDHAFLCFRTETEKEEAIRKITGYTWRGRVLKAKLAKAVLDPMLKKRIEESAGCSDKTPTIKPKKRTVLEAAAPFAHIPYEEQVRRKESECIKHLQHYANSVKKSTPQLKSLIQQTEKDNNGLPCIWHGYKKSPKSHGYRNKNEFAVGKNENGERTVGFRLGSYSDGSVEVGPVDDMPQVPDRSKLAAKLFENYVKASKYNVFCLEMYTGVFRQFTVRYSDSTGEIMLIFGIHTSEILDEIRALLLDLVDYFTKREGQELNVTSMYLEEMNKREAGQKHNKIEHLYGTLYITDIILGLKFRVSAASFFQVNTQSAEVMYDMAIQMGNVDAETTVLDICCGTGTIGLCFSQHCKEVLGVEIVEAAIQDAIYNAEDNQITNCKFYSGNCDDYIRSMVFQAENDNILAVIDPPRAGLQSKSKEAIRNASGLNRFIYIACSPKAALRNWTDFSRPCSKSLKGDPFILKEAAGIDMFPHTDHVEMVLLFERVIDEKPQPTTSSS